ncbi:hypothetical protein [Sphingomonas faeni]|uniref:hypothetical protein n=1 Tax=Sphingomonas faeni TaxID=185950 RepID=UPI0033596213
MIGCSADCPAIGYGVKSPAFIGATSGDKPSVVPAQRRLLDHKSTSQRAQATSSMDVTYLGRRNSTRIETYAAGSWIRLQNADARRSRDLERHEAELPFVATPKAIQKAVA